MKLAILSRAPRSYSTQRLRAAAAQRGHEVRVLNTLRFAIDLSGADPDLQYRGKPLSDYDAILPRIGNSITYFGTAVVRQFEQMDVYTPNTANGISSARDKLRATQILSRHNIAMPETAFVRNRAKLEKQLGTSVPVNLSVFEGDVNDATALRAAMAGHDVVINCAGYVADGAAFIELVDRVVTQAEAALVAANPEAPMIDLSTNARAAMLSTSPTLAVSARAGELRAQGKAVLNFSAGEPDFRPPAAVTAARACWRARASPAATSAAKACSRSCPSGARLPAAAMRQNSRSKAFAMAAAGRQYLSVTIRLSLVSTGATRPVDLNSAKSCANGMLDCDTPHVAI